MSISINSKNTKKPIANKWFNLLHQLPELDMFFETAKDYFTRKYNIDYLSIHNIHNSRSCFVGFYDHDLWHQYVYTHTGGIAIEDGIVVRTLPIIKEEEIYWSYFNSDPANKTEYMNMRAEIFGVRKYGGCRLIMSDQYNNITVYDVAFKDDSSFGTLDKKVLCELNQDLIKYRNLYLPFVEHANKYGDFSDNKTLMDSLDTFKKENWSLFHF